MNQIWKAGLAQLALHVESGDVSCREIVAAALARIERFDRGLGAFVRVRGEAALAEARAADEARAAGKARSRLHGLPIAVKDIFASRDFETTCGSKILAGFRAPYDATVLDEARRGGSGGRRLDQHGRVRDGLVDRELAPSTRRATRGTPRAFRAARRAAARPPSRRGSCPRRSAPTRAARSASRRHCAVSSA